MSIAQTWFALAICSVRNRYGQIVCPGARLLVFGLRYSAVIPMRRISVVMCLRPTAKPSARNRSRNMRAPANGTSRCNSSMRRISLRSPSLIGSLS